RSEILKPSRRSTTSFPRRPLERPTRTPCIGVQEAQFSQCCPIYALLFVSLLSAPMVFGGCVLSATVPDLPCCFSCSRGWSSSTGCGPTRWGSSQMASTCCSTAPHSSWAWLLPCSPDEPPLAPFPSAMEGWRCCLGS
ncbi:unnamed protein product, partial [Ixodes pacificus]